MIVRYTSGSGDNARAYTAGHTDDTTNALRYVTDAYVGEPLFVIRGRDMLAVPAIATYQMLCAAIIPASGMTTQVESHLDRFKAWRDSNPAAMKYPDPWPKWPTPQQ